MGTSTSAAQLAKKLDSLATKLADTTPALNAAGAKGKLEFQAALRAKGVDGSTKVSRAVKARFDVKGDKAVVVRYTGPAQILDRPTQPHVILSRRSYGGRKGRKDQASLATARVMAAGLGAGSTRGLLARVEATGKRGTAGYSAGKRGGGAINIPGVGHRAYAIHPGTKGLAFFDIARARSEKSVPKVYFEKQLRQPMRALFG